MLLFNVFIIIQCILFSYWILRKKFQIDSIRNVFIVMCFYYGLSVPIDLLVNVSVKQRSCLPNLNLPENFQYVIQASLFYTLCALCFMLAYITFPKLKKGRTFLYFYRRIMPSTKIVIIINIAVGIIFIMTFSFYASQMMSTGSAKQAYYLMAKKTIIFKLIGLLPSILLALNILFFIVNPVPKKTIFILIYTVVLGLITGDRSFPIIIIIVFLSRYRIAFSKWQIIAVPIIGIPLLTYWKVLYTAFLVVFGRETGSLWNFTPHFSLSGLEAVTSFNIFTYFIKEIPTPTVMAGSTYFTLPFLITWPRFIGGIKVATLAENFVWQVAPKVAAGGGGLGFSAMAESLINFGYLGPIFLGIIWGWIAKIYDTRARGVTFYILLCMTCRLFRSDFASLYKTWIVVFGSCLLLVIVVLWIINEMQIMFKQKKKVTIQRNKSKYYSFCA